MTATMIWRRGLWGGAAVLLAAPWVAMRFTQEVNWTGMDFAIFGGLLLSALVGWEAVTRLGGTSVYKAAWSVAILAAFLLVWADLAVGIAGRGDYPGSLIVGGVWVASIVISRLRAGGMAWAMAAVAGAQGVLCAVIVARGFGPALIAPTVFFCALWLLSAGLFHRSARHA